MIKHQARALMVTHLAFRQQQGNWPSLAVADGVQLGVQPALGAANTAGNSPFLSKLAAVRCALRCVLSIITQSGFQHGERAW